MLPKCSKTRRTKFGHARSRKRAYTQHEVAERVYEGAKQSRRGMHIRRQLVSQYLKPLLAAQDRSSGI